MNQETLFVFAKITPKAEYLINAREAILAIVEKTRLETGCKQFVLHDGANDGCLYLYEEWQNEMSLEEHYLREYTKDVFEKYQNWLAQPVEITRMVGV